MSASLTDILSAAQNFVIAVNNQTQTTLSINGTKTVSGITAATVVKSTSGRVCTVSVIVAGSGTGKIYDGNVSTSTTYPLWVIPMTVGITVINLPTNYGIVVAPGTGQTVTISYS
jgi:aspartate oxidase